MERYLIKVCGRVQGVGFRYFVQFTASMYNITGLVKNCDDGTVRMEVQGEDQTINKFLSKIRKGDMFIKVEDMVAKKIQIIEDDKGFKIKY